MNDWDLTLVFIYFQFSLMAPQRSAYDRVLLPPLLCALFLSRDDDGWMGRGTMGGAQLLFSVIACVVLRIDHVSHPLAIRLV